LDKFGLKQTDSANGRSVNIQMQGPTHHSYFYNADGTTTMTDTTTGATIIVTVPGSGIILGGGGVNIYTTLLDAEGNVISSDLVRSKGNINFSDAAWTAYCKYLSGK
jgi:hypothetical protein